MTLTPLGWRLKLAASIAFKEGFKKAKPVLLEPIMKVEVETPEENTGDVSIGDLSPPSWYAQGQESGYDVKIHAEVPLSGNVPDMQLSCVLDQGRASYTMEFLKYGVGRRFDVWHRASDRGQVVSRPLEVETRSWLSLLRRGYVSGNCNGCPEIWTCKKTKHVDRHHRPLTAVNYLTAAVVLASKACGVGNKCIRPRSMIMAAPGVGITIQLLR